MLSGRPCLRHYVLPRGADLHQWRMLPARTDLRRWHHLLPGGPDLYSGCLLPDGWHALRHHLLRCAERADLLQRRLLFRTTTVLQQHLQEHQDRQQQLRELRSCLYRAGHELPERAVSVRRWKSAVWRDEVLHRSNDLPEWNLPADVPFVPGCRKRHLRLVPAGRSVLQWRDLYPGVAVSQRWVLYERELWLPEWAVLLERHLHGLPCEWPRLQRREPVLHRIMLQ